MYQWRYNFLLYKVLQTLVNIFKEPIKGSNIDSNFTSTFAHSLMPQLMKSAVLQRFWKDKSGLWEIFLEQIMRIITWAASTLHPLQFQHRQGPSSELYVGHLCFVSVSSQTNWGGGVPVYSWWTQGTRKDQDIFHQCIHPLALFLSTKFLDLKVLLINFLFCAEILDSF